MNLSTIPTDNLYKFMAIFGLTLIVTSIYFSYSFEIQFNEKRIEYNQELNHYKNKNEIYSFKSTEQKKEIELLKKDLWDKSAQLTEEKIYLSKMDYYLHFLFWFGFIISGLGFLFWYIKHQIFIDEILEYQALEYRKK